MSESHLYWRNAMTRCLIVSRHPAAIEFIRRDARFATAPVIEQATEEHVRGCIVAGNLPLHLAALAAEVWAVEFSGPPPRGQEYDLAAMEAAGARLVPYRVLAVPIGGKRDSHWRET